MMELPWRAGAALLQADFGQEAGDPESSFSPEAAAGSPAGLLLCVGGLDCGVERLHVLLLFLSLCGAIASVLIAFFFFREDQEEQITPLCPQLVVREFELGVHMPLDMQHDAMLVTDASGRTLCKVVMDWTDPFRNGTRGVAATVRLQSPKDVTLATVVAKTMASESTGLVLCRGTCEMFGSVELSEREPGRYLVRHRSGVHLLALSGDFAALDIEGVNPAGSKVCSFRRTGAQCSGKVLQHVDLGLVICSLLATYVHRRLNSLAVAASQSPLSAPASLAAPPKEPAQPGLQRQRDLTTEQDDPSSMKDWASDIDAAPAQVVLVKASHSQEDLFVGCGESQPRPPELREAAPVAPAQQLLLQGPGTPLALCCSAPDSDETAGRPVAVAAMTEGCQGNAPVFRGEPLEREAGLGVQLAAEDVWTSSEPAIATSSEASQAADAKAQETQLEASQASGGEARVAHSEAGSAAPQAAVAAEQGPKLVASGVEPAVREPPPEYMPSFAGAEPQPHSPTSS